MPNKPRPLQLPVPPRARGSWGVPGTSHPVSTQEREGNNAFGAVSMCRALPSSHLPIARASRVWAGDYALPLLGEEDTAPPPVPLQLPRDRQHRLHL